MPARDFYHDYVRNALIKDGWTITDDPLHLAYGSKDVYADLGAEKIIAAERTDQKIAVEVKSFAGPSIMTELEKALGHFMLYQTILDQIEPDRLVYLATPRIIYKELFEEPIGQLLLATKQIRLIVFDQKTQEIVQWIS